MFAVSPTSFKQQLLMLSFRNGILHVTFPYRPDLWSALLIVVLSTNSPTYGLILCSSSRVTMGLLRLMFPFSGMPVQGGLSRFAVVQCFFHFLDEGLRITKHSILF
ncbi:hypothetical protein CHARACLAT_032775 [Characodon lateralis]|uniref:Uncharacterized protein n=1 Tax=Characodon lateralis TaxID=208331 RepID=A0ABU7DC21_9TELE|nr:hypothetical protein [Characodon lateralis]